MQKLMDRTVLLLLLTAAGYAQTAAVFPVHQENGKWFAKNISGKAIVAWVSHLGLDPLYASKDGMNGGAEIREWAPVAPGQTVELQFKPEWAAKGVEVPAVVFEDGTLVGSARTTQGLDWVDFIFRDFAGDAAETARLLGVLETSGVAGLEQETKHAPQYASDEDNGRIAAFNAVEVMLQNARQHSVAERYAYLHEQLAQHQAHVRAHAIRRAQ